jgi:general secretion pathway protein I
MARSNRGFTLIEMLVAMAILAVGMGAIIKASAENAANAAYLRDREVARWIAADRLTELQVTDTWGSKTSYSGDVDMLGIRWYWQARIRKVQDPDLRRVDVEVRRDRDSESYLFSSSGFLSNPELKVASE